MSSRYLPGSCVSCGQGTDTGLNVKGEGEFHIAFLTQLFGIPQDEAADTVSFARAGHLAWCQVASSRRRIRCAMPVCAEAKSRCLTR
jgi:hypothetical protein